MQGADAVVDPGRPGAVQDEQEPGEDGIASPPVLFHFPQPHPALCPRYGCGNVLVQAGVGGEFRGETFGPHRRPVHLDEGPQHRPAPSALTGTPVVQQRVGGDRLTAPKGVVDLGDPVQRPTHIPAAARVMQESQPCLRHRQRVACAQARCCGVGQELR